MSFTRTVPSNSRELHTYLVKMHDNRSHVKSVKVNLTTGHLEVDLDGMANFAGNPDVYMPIKRNKLNDAKILVERLLSRSASGIAPSEADSGELFDLIDPLAR